jgi:hypothetical protein
VSWRYATGLLAGLALVGCAASEGGVTGTGVTSISGNVSAVNEQLAQQLATLPFPIRVSIAEFTGVDSTTDAEGTFELAGEFSGAITLVFTNADSGAEIGPLRLEIPAGSQTVLENIEIRIAAPVPERVQPGAVRQFDVFGRADLVDCAEDGSGTVLLTDDGHPRRQFMLSLTSETEIADRAGTPLTCADIAIGATLRAAGFLRRTDQTLVAVEIVVAAPRPPRADPSPRPERLRGIVSAVACERGIITVEQSAVERMRRHVRVTDRTEFQCAAGIPAPCDCSAIAVAARVAVSGTIFPARPGEVHAEVVFIEITSVPVDLFGRITRVACGAGGLSLEEEETRRIVRVALTPATDIRCGAEMRCRCAALQADQRVRVEGHRPPEGGTVVANRVTVRLRLATR